MSRLNILPPIWALQIVHLVVSDEILQEDKLDEFIVIGQLVSCLMASEVCAIVISFALKF